jgi:hypothetical protein
MSAFRCGDRVQKLVGVGIGAVGYVQKAEPNGLLRVDWHRVPAGAVVPSLTFPEAIQRLPRAEYRHERADWRDMPTELRLALTRCGVHA